MSLTKEHEIAESLHPLEKQTLLPFRERARIGQAELIEMSGLSASQLRTAVEWLLVKGLLSSLSEGTEEFVLLTRKGEELAEKGSPEGNILRIFMEKKPESLAIKDLEGLTSMDQSLIRPAIGELKKRGLIDVSEGNITYKAASDSSKIFAREALLRKLKDKARVDLRELSHEDSDEVRAGFVKRSPEKGLFRIEENLLVTYAITDPGKEVLPYVETKPSVNQLTREMLESGKWREYEFRKYDISLNPPKVQIGRLHPYRQFLARVRSKLVSLGFEEMTGPVVETEFWDMDALFMPQFHSARNIHDIYYIKEPKQAKSIPEPFLSQVADSHRTGGKTGSSGWGYTFDIEKTRRLILRSQGTALSARTLAGGPKVPGKYFAIARCFRYDQIDATHGTDFFQVEGIVVDRDINFVKLLGLLQLFAAEIANARETKFTPGYFPFTEPSVELHAKHPVLGWMELGGAGIFRPEVTVPLNVDVPVIAWGLGIDRMAMVALGINDIRQLFSHDLEFIRQSKVVF